MNVSEWVAGSSQPLWGRYTSSCCAPQAELLVWDGAGNMRRCHLSSGQQRQKKERSTETSGAGKMTHTSFLPPCIGLIIVSMTTKVF